MTQKRKIRPYHPRQTEEQPELLRSRTPGVYRNSSGRREGYSREDFWGDTVHYDASGKKIGYSRKDFWGHTVNYNASGKKTGYSRENSWGNTVYYDASGKKTGYSRDGIWGDTVRYDASGKRVGTFTPSPQPEPREETPPPAAPRRNTTPYVSPRPAPDSFRKEKKRSFKDVIAFAAKVLVVTFPLGLILIGVHASPMGSGALAYCLPYLLLILICIIIIIRTADT